MDRLARASWWALLVFALAEVGVHAFTRAGVPSRAEWREAAAFVRADMRAEDLVVAAPAWADPLLRNVLGDRIDLAMAGRGDTAAYARLWALVIRDAAVPEAPPRAPELSRSFGRVTVKRWSLDAPSVGYDFVARVRDAEVTWQRRDGVRACPWSRFAPPKRGGLGFGVLYPIERFACDTRKSALWVAPVVMEDLDLAPRHCVWQHPAPEREPIRVTYRDVPLDARIVLRGGLYYEHERMRRGGPIRARVLVDGRVAGTLTHVDGDGWKALVVPTPEQAGRRGEVAVEVTAPASESRGFCWAATVRKGGGE